MAKLYCQVTGIVLLVVGVAGFFWMGLPGIVTFHEPGGIGLHLVLGIVSTYAGFSGGAYAAWAVRYARVFGIVYLALGAVGFLMPDITAAIHLDPGCNVVHLALGVWGIWAGYLAGGRQPAATTTARPQAIAHR